MSEPDDPAPNSPADVGAPAEAGGWTGGSTVAPRGSVTRCKSCRRPIRFVQMGSGEPMPVEAKSVLVIVERLTTPQRDLFGAEQPPTIAGEVTRGWIPHWSKCPDAERWRARHEGSKKPRTP